jgi:hypothetical protein
MMPKTPGKYGLRWAISLLLGLSIMSAGAGVNMITPRVTPPAQKPKPALVRITPAASPSKIQLQQHLPLQMLQLPSRTQLDILEDRGPEFRWWRKALFLDWRGDQYYLTPTFRWLTKEPKVASAVWQVSVFPFSSNTKNWQTPPGLVASGSLSKAPAPEQQEAFKIDFTQFAPKPTKFFLRKNLKANVLPVLTPAAPAIAAAQPPKIVSRAPLTISAQRKQQFSARKFSYRAAGQIFSADVQPVRYYVRLVTLDGKGQPAGVPTSPVEVTVGQPPDQPPVKLVDPGFQNAKHPVARIAKYHPIQFEQSGAVYHVIVIRDPFADVPLFFGNSPYYVGEKLDLTPKHEDKSWWDEFTGAVGDFFDAVMSAVNWVSNAYQSIKDFAINIIADAVGDWAKGPLSAGLDIGLAAMGIPPTLPNFDQLASLGEDYLVQTIAEQTGVPEEVTRKGVDAVISKAKDVENGGGNPAAWFKPDPDYYYRPAFLEIEVSNPTGEATDRMYLSVKNQGTDNPIFYDASLYVPALAPGEKLTIPVFLKENTGPGYVTSDPDSYNWPTTQTWYQEYHYKRKVVFSLGTGSIEPRQNGGKNQQVLQLDTKTEYAP